MKRIIAIILAFTMLFALASCGPKGDGTKTVDLTEFKNAVAATAPTAVKVEVTQKNDFLPDVPLTATYNIEYASDGSATVNFEYTLYEEIDENNPPEHITTTYTGAASIAPDGTVTGDKVGGTVTSVASVNFNLDESKMTSTASLGILTARIPAANTAAVLGTAIDADVTLTLSTANGVVVGATLSYTLGGSEYEIACTYN